MKNQTLEKTLEYITDGYFVLLCTLFLFAVSSEGYSNLVSLKYGLFLCLCGGYILLILIITSEFLGFSGLLALLKENFQNIKTRKPMLLPYHPSPLRFWIFAYLCFTTLSALLSPYDGTFLGHFRLDGVLTIWIYGISSTLVAMYYRPNPLHLWLCGISSTLFCALGWLQLLGKNPMGLYPEPYNYYDANTFYSGAYWSTVGNVNLCAVILTASVGIFSVTLIKKRGKEVWLATIPLFLSVFSAFALKSDSSMLAIGVGLLLLLPLAVDTVETLLRYAFVCGICGFALTLGLAWGTGYFRFLPIHGGLFTVSICLLCLSVALLKRKKFFTHCLGKLPWFFVLAVVLFGLLFLYFVPFSGGTLLEVQEILHGRADDTYGSGRIYIWREVWQLILENPWLGGGADTLGQREIPPFSRYSSGSDTVILAMIDTAHNEWLNIWVNQGIFALISYFGILLTTLRTLWQNRQIFPVLVAGSVVIFYQIQGFFGLSIMITAPYFWLAIAVANANYKS